jgi:hypothetical protein
MMDQVLTLFETTLATIDRIVTPDFKKAHPGIDPGFLRFTKELESCTYPANLPNRLRP